MLDYTIISVILYHLYVIYNNHSFSIPFMCDSHSLLYAKALCHIYTESIYSIPKNGIIMLSCKTYV